MLPQGFKDHADFRDVIHLLKDLNVMDGCMLIKSSSMATDRVKPYR